MAQATAPLFLFIFESSRVLDCRLLLSRYGKGGRHILVKDAGSVCYGSML